MYGYSVDLEYAHVTDLPDLMRVQQLHLACALIEIVAQELFDIAREILLLKDHLEGDQRLGGIVVSGLLEWFILNSGRNKERETYFYI